MADTKRPDVISLSIGEKHKQMLETLANIGYRSMTDEVRRLIERAVKEAKDQGTWPDRQPAAEERAAE